MGWIEAKDCCCCDTRCLGGCLYRQWEIGTAADDRGLLMRDLRRAFGQVIFDPDPRNVGNTNFCSGMTLHSKWCLHS